MAVSLGPQAFSLAAGSPDYFVWCLLDKGILQEATGRQELAVNHYARVPPWRRAAAPGCGAH